MNNTMSVLKQKIHVTEKHIETSQFIKELGFYSAEIHSPVALALGDFFDGRYLEATHTYVTLETGEIFGLSEEVADFNLEWDLKGSGEPFAFKLEEPLLLARGHNKWCVGYKFKNSNEIAPIYIGNKTKCLNRLFVPKKYWNQKEKSQKASWKMVHELLLLHPYRRSLHLFFYKFSFLQWTYIVLRTLSKNKYREASE